MTDGQSSPPPAAPPGAPAPAPAAPAPAHAAHAPAPAHRRHRRYKPMLPPEVYREHIVRNALVGLAIVFVALMVGVVGYHVTARLAWLDALVNASMILGGMGPVDPVTTASGKWFVSFYALFSGVVFISAMGVGLAPVVKRFLHRFHLDIEQDDDT